MRKIKLAIAALFLVLPFAANADLLDAFANGGFEGYTGNTNSFNNDVPPGWTSTAGTPDVFSADTTVWGMTWQASSTGGDFLHGIGWDGRNPPYVESALQIGLDGLIIGQEYEISFEQSISWNINSAPGGGFWEIIFGTESHASAAMALPGSGMAAPWQWQTLIFTAMDTIQTLEVIAHASGPGNFRADLGIDSFFLGDPGSNPDNPDTDPVSVPEPGTLALLGIGLFGMGLARRRRKA